MTEQTQILLNLVNQKLEQKPLIYFCKDSERATGLESLLKNYSVACVEDTYLTQNLAKKINVYCEQKVDNSHSNFSTLDLVHSANLQNWLRAVTNGNNFYAQFFQFSNPTAIKLKNSGAIILNNDITLNRKFEDKLSQYKFFKDNNIQTPQTLTGNISEYEYHYLEETIGSEFVVQMDRAHTGLGTFFIANNTDFENVQKQIAGNTVKFTKLIKGDSYTINGCVTKKGVFVSGLQYQITGIPELTNGSGSTVGNDFSKANDLAPEMKAKIFQMVTQIGILLHKDGYKGLFGIDLVLENNTNPLIIEINARQTANIALQTRLELKAGLTPLALINLAEFLNIDIPENPPIQILPLEGSQVFLRAKADNFKINHTLKSGVYRLLSDNSATNWDTLQLKEGVILIDEDGDKPLIWQKDGYNLEDIEAKTGGFILLIQKQGNLKAKFDEVARMQFNNRIISSVGLSPWVKEAFLAIENIIK